MIIAINSNTIHRARISKKGEVGLCKPWLNAQNFSMWKKEDVGESDFALIATTTGVFNLKAK
jgi:hypothetical protein